MRLAGRATPLYANSMLCARPAFFEKYTHLVSETLPSLGHDPEGVQLLTLFGVDRLVPFAPAHSAAVAELLGWAAP